MVDSGKSSKTAKVAGMVLILFVGLLNFHIPHFLIEPRKDAGLAGTILELFLLAIVVGAVIAAIGIYTNMGWGWLLGLIIAILCAMLYIAQETVGLPGLPQNWLEPSRIVSLIVEGIFVVLASRQVTPVSLDRDEPSK